MTPNVICVPHHDIFVRVTLDVKPDCRLGGLCMLNQQVASACDAIIIGIDPGTSTGYAVWVPAERCFRSLSSLSGEIT
jgi:hypothetical protein